MEVVRISGPSGGQEGVVNTDDTTEVNGIFYALQAVGGDVVFDTVTEENQEGSALDGWTLSSGQIVLGVFTSYKLTSGKLRAYKMRASE